MELKKAELSHLAQIEALEARDAEKAYQLALAHTEEVIKIYQSDQN